MSTKLLNHKYLSILSKEELQIILKDKKIQKAFECIVEFEKETILLSSLNLGNHQNTNRENYEFILRDFISDVIKSGSTLIAAIIYLKSNDIAKCLLAEKPFLVGHEIDIDVQNKIVSSLTVRDQLARYTQRVKLHCSNLKIHIETSQKVRNEDKKECLIVLNKALREKSDDVSVFYGKDCEKSNDCYSMIPHIVSRIGKRLDNIRKYSDALNADILESLRYLSHELNCKFNTNTFESIYHSVNLYDEKIIPKKSHIYFLQDNDANFELVASDACNITSANITTSYEFNCSFDMAYYVNKELISHYTRKDFLTFMSIYKDFNARYVFLNEDEKDYNNNHPFIKESQLLKEINKEVLRYKKRYILYFNLIQKEVVLNGNNLFSNNTFSYSMEQWQNKMMFPIKTHESIANNLRHHKLIEPVFILDEVNRLLSDGIKGILNKFSKESLENEKHIKNIETEENFINDSIISILNKLYTSIEYNNSDNESNKKYFNFRDRATFHTTLKDSYVLDFRSKLPHLNKKASEEKNEVFLKMVEIMKNHKYHDYFELDSSCDSKDSELPFEEIIRLLKASNDLNIPVNYKSALKLRKLGNYNANGIYFSHTKTMGLDFRKGKEAYIHEKAHHIDLNTENRNRNKLVYILREYFQCRITSNQKYFLKSEELIARAAETSLLLISGNFKEHINSHVNGSMQEGDLIGLIKTDFINSKYAYCMKYWDTYINSEEYINFPKLINEREIFLLNVIHDYFLPFWTGREASSELDKMLSSSQSATNENKFKSDSQRSYNYFYQDIYEMKPLVENKLFFKTNLYEKCIKKLCI